MRFASESVDQRLKSERRIFSSQRSAIHFVLSDITLVDLFSDDDFEPRFNQPERVPAENAGRKEEISKLFNSISGDLSGINAWRYQRQISGGIQEFIEALSFEHYLTNRDLITIEDASMLIPGGIQLFEDDYLLGLYDLVGELMRFAITQIATGNLLLSGSEQGSDPKSDDKKETGLPSSQMNIVTDLRELRAQFEALNTNGNGVSSGFGREVEKKRETMQTSVEKVEKAVYSLIVRGKERPEGWIPSSTDDPMASIDSVETY